MLTLKQWVSTGPGIDNDARAFSRFQAAGSRCRHRVWGLCRQSGDKVFYDHAILLKENGIYILETMNTGRLAREGVGKLCLFWAKRASRAPCRW